MSKFKPLVSIIIVNWNGKDNLISCVQSLQKTNYSNIEFIIVDNGSTDGSVIALRKMNLKRVTIILNKKNLGYAEANNIGVKKAKGELLLLLNNDTLVTRNFLNPLVKKLVSKKHIGAVQPKIMNYPQKEVIDSVGSYFISTGFLYHYGHNKKETAKYNEESIIFSMKGACMLFKKAVIDKVGLFESIYFAYFEESDLCHRIYLAGYKIYYVPESVIYHKGGNTAAKLPSSFIQFHSYKNRLYTYLKNFESVTLIRILPIHLFMYILVSFAFFSRFQFKLGFVILNSIWWNIRNIPLILKKRRIIDKSIRTVKDKDYLPKLTKHVRISYYYHLFTTSLTGYKD